MARQALVSQSLVFVEASLSHRHTTLGRTPLDEGSARRRDLYLTAHNSHKRDRLPCARQDSNPQAHQASGRRATH